MSRPRSTLRVALLFLVSLWWWSAAGAPAVWAQPSACSSQMELDGGASQNMQGVAHCVLEKPYPYLIGQDGKDIVMIGLTDIKQVSRLSEESKGDMIGLLIFEVERNDGSKRKLGLNGSTFWSGQGAGGRERIPFAKIKRLIISCQ